MREDEDIMEFRNLVSALQDLAKGQKDVLNAINRLSVKPEPGNSSTPLSLVDRGSTSSSGKHAYTNMQNTPHIYNRPSSMPTMPHFLADAILGPVMQVHPSEPFGAYLQEYKDVTSPPLYQREDATLLLTNMGNIAPRRNIKLH